jgi:hypothetical protein
LRQGWWNGAGLDWAQVQPLRNHYGKVHSALDALKTIRFAACKEVVTEFRDYWRSLSQLGTIGNDQMGQACDELLKSLRE